MSDVAEGGAKRGVMRMNAVVRKYSSVTGGGLALGDESGRCRFLVNFMGTTDGISIEENAALSERLAALINEHGLEVPERE